MVMDSRGRRGALRISAVLTGLGALLMTVASGYTPLVIGRCVPSVLQNIPEPTKSPQTVDRHRCWHWRMSDPNLHRRSITGEDSRQSWSVYFAKPQFRSLLTPLVGVFTQLSIVVGIMITQLVGFKLATPTTWRYVLLLSALAAVAQFLISPSMVESPVWVIRSGDPQSGKVYRQKLWKDGDSYCRSVMPFKWV